MYVLEVSNCSCFNGLCVNCDGSSTEDDIEYLISSSTTNSSDENLTTDDEFSSDESTIEIDAEDIEELEEIKEIKLNQISNTIDEIDEKFKLINKRILNYGHLSSKLNRQRTHCLELINCLEDFMLSYEYSIEDPRMFNENWPIKLNELKKRFKEFKNQHTNYLKEIPNLNNKLEFLFQDFQHQIYETSPDLNLSELNNLIDDYEFILLSLNNIDLKVNNIMNFNFNEIEQQRKLINDFIQILTSILCSIGAEINNNHIIEFDCYSYSSFVQRLIIKVNNVNII